MKTFRLLILLWSFSFLTLSATMAATNVFSVLGGSFVDYTINGQADPSLTLVRGFTYTFNLNASGHPFWIKTPPGGTGTGNAYNDGVTGNGTSIGTITFSVPNDAPDTLQYNCQHHSAMTGTINIVAPPAIVITDLSFASDAVITSTGTDALNLNIQLSTNLALNTWTDAEIQFNSYGGGTNTTTVALPEAETVFFQVQQGFF